MKKQVRPLKWFKENSARFYGVVLDLASTIGNSASKKGKENDFYHALGIMMFGGELKQNIIQDLFFFREDGNSANKGTITELGRLFLIGMYYGEATKTFALKIGDYVHKSYHRKREKGEPFNDLEFKDAVKHIRDNFGYYWHNQDETKLYIVKTFFTDEVNKMLPEPPEELSEYYELIEGAVAICPLF